ncbi:hypothetical protein EMIHUDRAFT_450971 [Emiliania huxleyi CCMP1516]|uniref:Neurotransmitter-gated ion-channel ligand-binding domain-containing protein n=2 Tax=Emiliania huxleyi TaxID=2903 RepID=A0A0D3JAL0_EMIH1|nr:hypothetical protein EMIHUDRAFT_450971 [Emiliania huxleyi CCMP1516]EOD20545.1 hypothetical protein EMIHUDRAFT_450971 [Emiliania huxleyi CCMP1516]|eukprot:XP_005772974.1 hypothetical protein EMIHUDRAFT_450971 [Emiliania huxleyi CCMP1516]
MRTTLVQQSSWSASTGAKDRRESFVTFKDGATESVEWFAGRVEVLNSFEHDSCKLIDEKPTVRDDGEDLLIQLRFEGRFYQPMRLHAFPFDSQELSIKFIILCRVDGPAPAEVNVSPRVICRLVDSGFAPRFQWRPKGQVRCHAGTHEANGRTFPKFGASVRVARESRFYVTNVALPTAVFSGLAFTLFAAQPSEPMERLSVAFTLLLTMAAYKITVSYETLLDQFLLCNFFLLVAMAIVSAVLPQADKRRRIWPTASVWRFSARVGA